MHKHRCAQKGIVFIFKWNVFLGLDDMIFMGCIALAKQGEMPLEAAQKPIDRIHATDYRHTVVRAGKDGHILPRALSPCFTVNKYTMKCV